MGLTPSASPQGRASSPRTHCRPGARRRGGREDKVQIEDQENQLTESEGSKGPASPSLSAGAGSEKTPSRISLEVLLASVGASQMAFKAWKRVHLLTM